MKRNRKYWVVVLCAIIIVGLLSGAAISEESITIIGTVNEDYQIVADDGQLFIFAEPEKVKKLDEIIKMKVKVTGTAEESEGLKIITITSYEVIGEKTVTIVGTINADYRIVTDDGQVYEVEDDGTGGELIELVGKKVRVMGMIGEYEGTKIILVTSYEVIGKKTVTIVGTINADYRIVTDDGQVYEVEDDGTGGELIELVGKKVRVMGMIGEYEGTKIILVTSYEVIGK